jgi:hypothetical protein
MARCDGGREGESEKRRKIGKRKRERQLRESSRWR